MSVFVFISFNLHIFISWLTEMDGVNFSAEKIESYYNDVVDSVYTLHEQSVYKLIDEQKIAADKEEQERIEIPCATDTDLNNVDGLDDYTKFVVNKLRTRGKLSNTVGAKVNTVNSDKMFEELKKRVKDQLKEYRDFWSNAQLNMVTILDEYGNERYKLDKKRNKINYTMITLVNCAAYVGKYFDVLGWWMANNKLYPELAVRACLVLGKPTHNGFQERVFSRGTYQDTKLKKRLKEENFEMSVLNAINNRKVQNLQGMMDFGLESLLSEISDADKDVVQEQQAQEIHDFFQRGIDTEEEDGKPKADEVKDGKPKADEVSDDNETDSIFSDFCENICLDGDDDELSIAQMCQNMLLGADEDDTISFEYL
jgi:hypothetical protein